MYRSCDNSITIPKITLQSSLKTKIPSEKSSSAKYTINEKELEISSASTPEINSSILEIKLDGHATDVWRSDRSPRSRSHDLLPPRGSVWGPTAYLRRFDPYSLCHRFHQSILGHVLPRHTMAGSLAANQPPLGWSQSFSSAYLSFPRRG